MDRLISPLVMVLISSCTNGAEADGSFQVPTLKGKYETNQLVKNSWKDLLRICPGLNKYQNDLSFAGIYDMLDPSMGKMSRAEVKFKVSENPKIIPNIYRAWGHTCNYGISPRGKTLRIQKRVCVSICIDSVYQGSTDYVVDM